MAEIHYKKVGRRYVPISEEFQGFPKEGVWIVSKKGEAMHWSGYWIMRLGDTPSAMTLAAFARHQDAIASAISKVLDWSRRSPNDLAQEVIRAVAENEEK